MLFCPCLLDFFRLLIPRITLLMTTFNLDLASFTLPMQQFHRWMPHINLIYPFWEVAGDNFTVAEQRMVRLQTRAGIEHSAAFMDVTLHQTSEQAYT